MPASQKSINKKAKQQKKALDAATKGVEMEAAMAQQEKGIKELLELLKAQSDAQSQSLSSSSGGQQWQNSWWSSWNYNTEEPAWKAAREETWSEDQWQLEESHWEELGDAEGLSKPVAKSTGWMLREARGS